MTERPLAPKDQHARESAQQTPNAEARPRHVCVAENIGASGIALGLGVPAAIVGVTIVSVGTTLPELVTGVMSVRKGQTDLAMGNALGSCLFNVGAIFGISSLISPISIDSTLVLPLGYMAILGLALIPISRSFNRTVSRLEGAALLASYAVFVAITAARQA